MKSVKKSRQTKIYSLSEICSEYSLSRDSYYKYKKRQTKRLEEKDKVLKLVKSQRKVLPREGVRKLYNRLGSSFLANNLKIGRDKLFDILREEDILVKRKKASFKTTHSYHHFHKYNNLIKNIEIKRVNQVWVSDITYIRTVNGFCYLAIITDVYSRKIVGFIISSQASLKAQPTKCSLNNPSFW